jgi:hypothetical protein
MKINALAVVDTILKLDCDQFESRESHQGLDFVHLRADRFVSDFNATIEHYLLNVPVAQGKSLIQPDAVADNFARKSMTGVHGQAGKLNAEPVRLFYIRVKLTMPCFSTNSTHAR